MCARSQADASTFSTNPVTHKVHRHVIRAAQSNCHAVKESIRLGTRLYVSTACDEVTDRKEILFTDAVRRDLLERANLHRVKKHPGILLLYRGMRLLLYSKLCVRFLLMSGCEYILEDLTFAVEELLPPMVFAGTPIAVNYMPSQLLLRAVGAQWRLPATQLPPLPDDYDRDGLFLLAPHTAYLEYSLGEGVLLDIRRTHFQVLPADARVVHSAQGGRIETSVIDVAKPPSMSEEEHWLANYVMLTRARSLEGLLILRLPNRESLKRGAPKHLVAGVNRLLRLEITSTAALKRRLALLEGVLPAAVFTTLSDLFCHDTIGSEVYDAYRLLPSSGWKSLPLRRINRQSVRTSATPIQRTRRSMRNVADVYQVYHQIELDAPADKCLL